MNPSCLYMFQQACAILHNTLESRIDVGQRIIIGHGKLGKKNKHRALSNKVVGPGKNPKSINIGPTSILEARVRRNQNPNWLILLADTITHTETTF